MDTDDDKPDKQFDLTIAVRTRRNGTIGAATVRILIFGGLTIAQFDSDDGANYPLVFGDAYDDVFTRASGFQQWRGYDTIYTITTLLNALDLEITETLADKIYDDDGYILY